MTIPWEAHYDHDAPEHITFPDCFLQEYLDKAADRFGNRKAIVFHNYKMNYTKLRQKAENFAAALRELGIEKGDRIAIMLPNIPQTIIAFWGALKAGAVVVMTNPLYMERELTHHFHDSKPKLLITLDLFWSKIEKLRDKLEVQKYIVTRVSESLAFPLNILQHLKARKSGEFAHIPFDDNVLPWKKLLNHKERYSEPNTGDPKTSLALLQYTGGTTGFSKGAMLTHANISIQIEQIMAILRDRGEDQIHLFISVMPFFHVFGLMGCLVLPTAFACATIPVPRYVPSDLLEIIKKYRPTFFIGAPSIYISLMQQKKIVTTDMTCIQFCIAGSSPFPVASMKKFQDITKAKITEGLGITEASPVATANPLHGLQKAGSVGVPVPGTYAKIVDIEDGTKELANNQPGELLIKGPQIMLGYWNHPEETANSIRDGWFYTGDIAYRDDDGYYFIVDRKKDMAIVGGYNVYPSEIDQVLYEYPKIHEAVSLSIPHRSKGEILKAYIVPKAGENISAAEIMAFCREKLAAYKVPRLIEFRDELPKSMVGKILRRALRDEEEQKIISKKNESKQEDSSASPLQKDITQENIRPKKTTPKEITKNNATVKSIDTKNRADKNTVEDVAKNTSKETAKSIAANSAKKTVEITANKK